MGRASRARSNDCSTKSSTDNSGLMPKLHALLRSPSIRSSALLALTGLGFAGSNLIFASLMEPTDYGLLTLLVSILNVAAPFAPLGLDGLVIRHRLPPSRALLRAGVADGGGRGLGGGPDRRPPLPAGSGRRRVGRRRRDRRRRDARGLRLAVAPRVHARAADRSELEPVLDLGRTPGAGARPHTDSPTSLRSSSSARSGSRRRAGDACCGTGRPLPAHSRSPGERRSPTPG